MVELDKNVFTRFIDAYYRPRVMIPSIENRPVHVITREEMDELVRDTRDVFYSLNWWDKNANDVKLQRYIYAAHGNYCAPEVAKMRVYRNVPIYSRYHIWNWKLCVKRSFYWTLVRRFSKGE